MPRRAALFCLPLLMLWAAGCGGGPDYSKIRNLHSRGGTIVFLGDSLTAGVGAKPGESIPSLLEAALPLPVVNAGVRGDTAAQALARLEHDVLPHNPRLVVVMLGGNDALRKIPQEQTGEAMRAIVRRCQSEGGAMVAVVALKLSFFGDSYAELFERVAREEGALLVPNLWKGIFGKKEFMSDGIHPNARGYAAMAERLEPQLGALLDAAEREN